VNEGDAFSLDVIISGCNNLIQSGEETPAKLAEALKAAGKSFTRASFLKTLTSTTLSQTPALLPLRYTSNNHQGLNGGYLVSVTSATSTAPLNGTVYETDSTPNGPVHVTTKLSTGIPSWLK